ncbi:hypothetical protein CPC08DRAFT_767768 [Agrocybe pediades]|nr:hypothetical protein CPC08DRAFT_767768 [Agrocybe pediades]
MNLVRGILGKKLNTPFGPTIVLIAVWVELAAVSLFIGVFVSRSILGQLGTAATR